MITKLFHNMYRYINVEIKEHRLCVKIIRHFFANIYGHGHILKNLNDMGPITPIEYNKLKELIMRNKEYVDGQNEIPEFYYLLFKYVMDIKNDLFKLKSSINGKYSLIDTLLPDYNYIITDDKNLCKNKWETLKLTTDEYEITALIGDVNINEFFKCVNVSNEYHENRKKLKIIDNKVNGITSNFKNFSI